MPPPELRPLESAFFGISKACRASLFRTQSATVMNVQHTIGGVSTARNEPGRTIGGCMALHLVAWYNTVR